MKQQKNKDGEVDSNSILFIFAIVLLILIVSIVFSSISYHKYKEIYLKYKESKNNFEHFKTSPLLYNAIHEGYLYAKEHENDFVAGKYKELLHKLQREDR